MYTTHDKLAAILDVHPDTATLIRLEQAARCAVCKTPPGPLDAPVSARRSWALRFGSRLGSRFGLPQPHDRLGSDEVTAYDYEQVTALVHDSQLKPVVGVPEDVVEVLLNELPEDELGALANELAFAMCDRCLYSSTIAYETSDAIRQRYVDERFAGDAGALLALDVSGAIRRLLKRIDDVMLRRVS
jgi:hypothetical protein